VTAWSEAELALLCDTSLSLAEVARRTGRPIHGVENRAWRLGVRRKEPSDIDWSDPVQVKQLRQERYNSTDRTEWTEEELAVLRDPSLSYSQVAELTSRTWIAAKVQARRLGLRRDIYWAQPGYEPGSDAYRGEDWSEFRQLTLERDGYTCQDCRLFLPSGERGLVAHHVIPWRLRPINDLAWLVTLCRSCHMKRPEHRWEVIPEDVGLLLR
jgi:5-methylcytosine-specific restriction endonuclease McrA